MRCRGRRRTGGSGPRQGHGGADERRSHGDGRRCALLLLVDDVSGVDQKDPRRILGGRCPRRRSISISPGARGWSGSGGAARVRI
jgi:hypothetical protein